MGEKQHHPFQLLFNASLKVDFQGSRVTSDGGLILVRELDERLGLEKFIEEHLSDSRQGFDEQFTLSESTAAVGVHPLGGLRGYQRRRTTGSRSDVPIDQFAEGLGPGRGAAITSRIDEPRTETDFGANRDWRRKRV
jgi:hypothetical protein